MSARDLLQAQQRALAALEELNRVRQAYEASEHSRHQALQVATVLFALLGQAQSQVAQLTRRLDALNETPAPVLEDISATHLRLGRAQAQEEDLRVQLARAEAEREKAQSLADIAARRIQTLETELHDMRRSEGLGVPRVPDAAVQLPDAVSSCSNDDAALDQVDAALQKARHVLDREHEVVEELAGELGWQGASSDRDLWTTVVPGQSRRQDSTAPDSNGGRRQRFSSDSELSGTTLNNTVTRHSGPGTDLAVRQAGNRMRFVGAATRRIARGIDLDEIVMGLCRATVPTFSDAILVYLRDPLPVGDERPTGPLVLRLRRTDRIPEERDTESGFLPALGPEPSELPVELCEVRPGGALAEVLRGVRPVFADASAARAALSELLGDGLPVPSGQRAILAPLRGRRRVIGAALFLRRPERLAFEADDLLVAAQLATHSALSIENSIANFDASLSDELQRTMLPETLPRLMGVRLASRYLPAAQRMLVGGDWYDAIPLPGSRVGLFVGDVMGHSRTSAAIMG
ncbi:hypothetical protein ACWCQ4_20010, partial [Streptomyces aureus]